MPRGTTMPATPSKQWRAKTTPGETRTRGAGHPGAERREKGALPQIGRALPLPGRAPVALAPPLHRVDGCSPVQSP